MNLHSHRSPAAIFSGPGSVQMAGDALVELGGKKAVLICDHGIEKAGLNAPVVDSIRKAGLSVQVIPEVEADPSASSVNSIVASVRKGNFDCVVGVGGGSSMDTAKLASALAVIPAGSSGNAEIDVRDYLGTNLIPGRGLPMVMVATTSGTGSEVTPNAIVSLPDEVRKVGAVSRHLVPDIAILDPDLTMGLPPAVTAATGLDALIHCLESYIGKKANVLSDGYALQGLRLIAGSLRKAYHHPDDGEAREMMLVGSCYGGMALTAAGTAAVHALAYATGAKYHIPHGVANSMLLVPVLEKSLSACGERLAHVGEAMGITGDSHEVLAYLKSLTAELKIPRSLATFGYRDEDLDGLVAAAAKVTRLLDNNPKAFTNDDIRDVFVAISHE
ncbi:MAG: iron-containing alcohol dehydrogenase [Spirochaetales bacterium]|nr:iron-containing alcohol dehydrogenase [Spirochaetales bacterium]